MNQYTFQQDELVKNSFEIFIKNQKYEEHITAIETLISDVKNFFRDNETIDVLQKAMSEFINGYKATKTGFSAAGVLGKGLAKGNKLEHIPEGLEIYEPYLHHAQSAKWLDWQFKGKDFLDVSNCCPYCTSGEIETKKETILKLGKEYDTKYIEHLNSMLEIFEKLAICFSEETNVKIKELAKSATQLSPEQAGFLAEINNQIETFSKKLQNLKDLGFNAFKNVENIMNELGSYKIDMNYLSHLQSAQTTEKVTHINVAIDSLVAKAGKLQGEITQQKHLIAKNIEEYQDEINHFLEYAGYNYCVFIEDDQKGAYKLKLRHKEFATTIQGGQSALSFGERNAFALVLFMYDAISKNPDLIILDDPISSFDGNKKFAILQMLFLEKRSLQNKTVLLLTHEFGTIIDSIYTFADRFHAKAAFLQNNNGILSEIPIKKRNIKSAKQIMETNISDLTEDVNKLVYLRRYLELNGEKNMAWQLLSNLFHKRATPKFHESGLQDDGTAYVDRDMTEDEIIEGTKEIKAYIPAFLYKTELAKFNDDSVLTDIYKNSRSGYEKLQIYRIIKNDNNDSGVVKKFVNETFHIENDYLFQLNPCEYELIPQYIIDECDKDLSIIA